MNVQKHLHYNEQQIGRMFCWKRKWTYQEKAKRMITKWSEDIIRMFGECKKFLEMSNVWYLLSRRNGNLKQEVKSRCF